MISKSVGFFPPRGDIDRAGFIDHYERVHAPLATRLLPLEGYRRNHFVEADPLGYVTISEFWGDMTAMGAVLAGPDGETLRADELNFMDKPHNRAARADTLVAAYLPDRLRIILLGGSGSCDALAAGVRRARGGLDLLEPFDDRPLPCTALVRVPIEAEIAVPAGWSVVGDGAADCRVSIDPPNNH